MCICMHTLMGSDMAAMLQGASIHPSLCSDVTVAFTHAHGALSSVTAVLAALSHAQIHSLHWLCQAPISFTFSPWEMHIWHQYNVIA